MVGVGLLGILRLSIYYTQMVIYRKGQTHEEYQYTKSEKKLAVNKTRLHLRPNIENT